MATLYWEFWINLGNFISSTGLLGHLLIVLCLGLIFALGYVVSDIK